MNTPTAPLSLAVVAVLDRLPDPPATFTAADVLGALASVRADGQTRGPDADALDVAGVLDALLSAEMASCTADDRPAYVVHAEARPF